MLVFTCLAGMCAILKILHISAEVIDRKALEKEGMHSVRWHEDRESLLSVFHRLTLFPLLPSHAQTESGHRADAVDPPGWRAAWLVPAQVRQKMERCEPTMASFPGTSSIFVSLQSCPHLEGVELQDVEGLQRMGQRQITGAKKMTQGSSKLARQGNTHARAHARVHTHAHWHAHRCYFLC